MALLAWVNALLFGATLLVNQHFGSSIGPVSRRHETLLTPAPYAFAIWGLIYALLMITVLVDCLLPSRSFYETAAFPSFLRILFGISCLANMAWVWLFVHDWIHCATLVLLVLWLCLLALFVFIALGRFYQPFCCLRYLASELAIVIYFAWTCAAFTISLAVSSEKILQHHLSLTLYLGLLTMLFAGAISAVVYGCDTTFGLVVIWALIGVANKPLDLDSTVTETTSFGVKVAATQAAAAIAVMILVSNVHRLFSEHRTASCGEDSEAAGLKKPFVGDTRSVDYGTV